MPKLTKKNTVKTKPKIEKMICNICAEEKKCVEFYMSESVFNAGTGRVPYCKDCIRNMSIDNQGNINLEKFKKVLKEIDKPYIHEILQSSYAESQKTENPNSNVVGTYFKNINSLNQYKGMTWVDSIFEEELEDVIDSLIDFKITDEIVKRWGRYSPEDYIKLEQFYWDMKDKNRIETPQEETYLKKLALISMKMDIELEKGNYDKAKKLGDLFSKYMADSQFRTIDKTEADKKGGLRSFSQVYAEVESDGFIPPWEHYRKIKGLDQDIVDKTIMYLANFTLKLNKVKTMIEPPDDTPKLSEGDF